MGMPLGLSYEIVKYKEDTDALIRTDLELLREKEATGTVLDRVVKSEDPEANKTAVILQMRLGVSSYATMALREFMKADTSRLSANFDVKTGKTEEK